jgi:hypothetical protein
MIVNAGRAAVGIAVAARSVPATLAGDLANTAAASPPTMTAVRMGKVANRAAGERATGPPLAACEESLDADRLLVRRPVAQPDAAPPDRAAALLVAHEIVPSAERAVGDHWDPRCP